MAGIVEIFRRIVCRSGDANLLDHGSITTPQQPTGTTITGKPIAQPKTFSLAAGASKLLWSYANDGDFSIFFAECSGFAWLAEKVDKYTSTTDPTPLGTAINYPKSAMSCAAPHIIDTMLRPVLTNQTTYAASAFTSAVAGRVYEIWIKNPSDTDAIDVTFGWAL